MRAISVRIARAELDATPTEHTCPSLANADGTWPVICTRRSWRIALLHFQIHCTSQMERWSNAACSGYAIGMDFRRRTPGPPPTVLEIAPHAASAGRTRLAISAPRSRSMTAMSYWLCRSSQNWARFPKYLPSLTAVSAVIDRRPFSMSVMRPDGTLRSSASRFALSSRAFNSRLKRLPGCVANGML